MNESEVLSTALEWHQQGLGVAIATVIETWGSSPRPPGSQLVIDQNGRFEGSVSGGCVEGTVVERATEVIATGQPLMLAFGVTNEQAWDVGLACGGSVRIYLEKLE